MKLSDCLLVTLRGNAHQRLKFMRKKKGYTQLKLVKAFGVSQSQVSKIERGLQGAYLPYTKFRRLFSKKEIKYILLGGGK